MEQKFFFDNLAHKWDSICNHDEKKLRYIIELADISTHSRILDVGTGTGVLIEYLLRSNPKKIVALDISENMLQIAKDKYKEYDNIEFIQSDIYNYIEEGFDYIFLYSVYPHLLKKELLFNKFKNILNKNGKVIIAHSESRKLINLHHSKKKEVRNHMLASGEKTKKVMKNYFDIENIIDNEELYFISGRVK